MKGDFINAVLSFLGLFNLTKFEKEILNKLDNGLSSDYKIVLKNQLKSFNRVERFLGVDERLNKGWTNFYFMKKGESKSPNLRFPYSKEEEKIASMLVSESNGNIIIVDLIMIKGVLFCIEYRSENSQYYPLSNYSFDKVEVLI